MTISIICAVVVHNRTLICAVYIDVKKQSTTYSHLIRKDVYEMSSDDCVGNGLGLLDVLGRG